MCSCTSLTISSRSSIFSMLNLSKVFRNVVNCVWMMGTCLEAGQNTRQDYLGRSSALVADRTCRFCSWWTPGICSDRTRRAWQDISGGSHGSHAARTSSCPPAFDPSQEVGSTSRGQFVAAALASLPCLWLPSSSASWCAKMRASGACPPFSIGSTLCWSRPMCSRAPEKNTHNQVFTFTQFSPEASELPAVLPPTDVPPLFASQSNQARSPKDISNDTKEQIQPT